MKATTFKETFIPLSRQMYRTAYSMLGNPQDAEDMVQEAFIKLWQTRNRLPAEGRLEGYVITLTRNLCIDSLRRQGIVETDLSAEDIMATDGHTASSPIETKETADEVEAAIHKLPKHQEQVVGMSIVEGLSPQEIERETGFSAVNVRVLLSRGKQKLQKLLRL